MDYYEHTLVPASPELAEALQSAIDLGGCQECGLSAADASSVLATLTQPQSTVPHSPELVGQMWALVKALSKVPTDTILGHSSYGSAARAIVAQTQDAEQPVDPDRAIALQAVNKAQEKHGMNDRAFGFDCALAAIKHFRKEQSA